MSIPTQPSVNRFAPLAQSLLRSFEHRLMRLVHFFQGSRIGQRLAGYPAMPCALIDSGHAEKFVHGHIPIGHVALNSG